MEMSICSKATAFPMAMSPSKLASPPLLPSLLACNRASTRAVVALNAATHEGKKVPVSATGRYGSLRGGAAVLERPTFDQSQFDRTPEAEEGGDIGSIRDRRDVGSGDNYRVLLIDDVRHTENLVAKVVPRAVPSVSPDNARKLFHESREHEIAVVIVALKEHAEFYAQMLVRGGLRSAIEPDSNMA